MTMPSLINPAFQRNSLARRSVGVPTENYHQIETRPLPRSLTEFDLTTVDDFAFISSQQRFPTTQMSTHTLNVYGIPSALHHHHFSTSPPAMAHQQHHQHSLYQQQTKPREKTVTFDSDVKFSHNRTTSAASATPTTTAFKKTNSILVNDVTI